MGQKMFEKRKNVCLLHDPGNKLTLPCNDCTDNPPKTF